jgi:hypothetical protein
MHPSTHRSSQGRSDLDLNLDLPTHAVSTYRSTHLDKVLEINIETFSFSQGGCHEKKTQNPCHGVVIGSEGMGDSATGRAEGRLRVWLTVMMFILGVDRGCCRRRRIFSWVSMVRR